MMSFSCLFAKINKIVERKRMSKRATTKQMSQNRSKKRKEQIEFESKTQYNKMLDVGEKKMSDIHLATVFLLINFVHELALVVLETLQHKHCAARVIHHKNQYSNCNSVFHKMKEK